MNSLDLGNTGSRPETQAGRIPDTAHSGGPPGAPPDRPSQEAWGYSVTQLLGYSVPQLLGYSVPQLLSASAPQDSIAHSLATR